MCLYLCHTRPRLCHGWHAVRDVGVESMPPTLTHAKDRWSRHVTHNKGGQRVAGCLTIADATLCPAAVCVESVESGLTQREALRSTAQHHAAQLSTALHCTSQPCFPQQAETCAVKRALHAALCTTPW